MRIHATLFLIQLIAVCDASYASIDQTGKKPIRHAENMAFISSLEELIACRKIYIMAKGLRTGHKFEKEVTACKALLDLPLPDRWQETHHTFYERLLTGKILRLKK